jgi:hypothetical protein
LLLTPSSTALNRRRVPTTQDALAISRGNAVAILEKRKAAPKESFRFMLTNQYYNLVAGIGFEPMTFRL